MSESAIEKLSNKLLEQARRKANAMAEHHDPVRFNYKGPNPPLNEARRSKFDSQMKLFDAKIESRLPGLSRGQKGGIADRMRGAASSARNDRMIIRRRS